MAQRYTVQPAQNDPVWGSGPQSRRARVLLANVEPLRTKAGRWYPGVPDEIVRAWLFRNLRSADARPGDPGTRRSAPAQRE